MLLISFIAMLCHQSLAQDTIIVTADRIKSEIEASPSDITVFNDQEVQAAQSLGDLMENETDLTVGRSGPLGGNTSLFLRGTDSSHTLVVIDGIIMNDPSNPNKQFDLGRLSLNNIEKVEVLKGSQGLLYGSNAIGGVILITSKQAREKLSASSKLEYGSFDTVSAAVDVQSKLNSTDLSFGIDHLKSSGFSAANDLTTPTPDADGVRRTSLSAGLVRPLGASSTVRINYHYLRDDAELDKSGGNGGDDPNDSQWSGQQFFKLETSQDWSNAETKFLYTKSLHHRTLYERADPMSPSNSATTTKGSLDSFALNHSHYATDRLTINANLDFQHEADQLKNINESLGVFVYTRYELSNTVFNLGGRIDHNKYFGDHVTYKLAALRSFAKINLKASLSSGFKAPSLNQLFDPTYGNKSLQPETSHSVDAGGDIQLGQGIKFEAAFFSTEIKNRLSYDPVTFVNLNRGKARIMGLENTLHAQISEIVSSTFAATWLSAKDKTTNADLPRRPEFKADFMATLHFDRQRLSFGAKYLGARADVDNAGNPVTMKSSSVFNIECTQIQGENLQSYLKIKNLLDYQYEEIYGYASGGRTVTVGLRYAY